MNRRDFLKTGGIIAATAISGCKSGDTPASGANMTANSQKTTLKFPRYRGFNFPVGFGSKGPQRRKFDEKDFEIIKEWGFDFGRIPMSYWNWADKDDWYNIDEEVLKEIDAGRGEGQAIQNTYQSQPASHTGILHQRAGPGADGPLRRYA